jgi:hypothetical protein
VVPEVRGQERTRAEQIMRDPETYRQFNIIADIGQTSA